MQAEIKFISEKEINIWNMHDLNSTALCVYPVTTE